MSPRAALALAPNRSAVEPVDILLQALRRLGLDYRPDERSLDSWRAACPHCVLYDDGERPLTITRRGHLRCSHGCDPDKIAAQLMDALDGPEEHRPSGEAENDASRTTWAAVELAALLDGSSPESPPTMLERRGGEHILYPAKIHAIHGEPESCKGWLALAASAEQLARGERVIYFDFEDDAGAIVARLLALGVDRTAILERFHYIRPDEPLDARAWSALEPILDQHPGLAVIDGVTEALTLHGLDLESNADVARWLALLPRRLVTAGAAVLTIDHVTKDKETRGRYAIGAQHKLAGVAVAYKLTVIDPFGRGREGRVKVTVTKDRPGYVRQHAEAGHVADMRLSSRSDGSVRVNFEPPTAASPTFRPTALMQKIFQAVEQDPGLTKSAIRTTVNGKNDAKDLALELLVSEGSLTVQTEGQAHHHYITPDANEPHRAPLPQPCPNPAPAGSEGNRAPLPPSTEGQGNGHGPAEGANNKTVPHTPEHTLEDDAELDRLVAKFHADSTSPDAGPRQEP